MPTSLLFSTPQWEIDWSIVRVIICTNKKNKNSKIGAVGFSTLVYDVGRCTLPTTRMHAHDAHKSIQPFHQRRSTEYKNEAPLLFVSFPSQATSKAPSYINQHSPTQQSELITIIQNNPNEHKKRPNTIASRHEHTRNVNSSYKKNKQKQQARETISERHRRHD